MNNLDQQEKQLEIQKLRELIHSIPIEAKKEYEWQLLENTIIAQLEDIEKGVPQKSEKPLFMPIAQLFPKKILAMATAACLALLIGVGSFFYADRFSPKPLVHSKILGANGDITFKTPEQDHLLFQNQSFETAENATLIVQIDKESNFILSEKSRLTINKANSRDIEFYLHKGNLLASVSKRRRNQSFTIVTPDAACKVVGTIFSIAVHTDNDNRSTTNLTVMEGTVAIADQKDPIINKHVESGQTVSLQNSILSETQQVSDNQKSNHSISLLRLALEMSKEETVPTGLIDIKSNPPNAKVFIQDVYIGTTPMALKYPAGTYNLKLSLPGFDTWHEKITLKRLHSSFVSASFAKPIIEISSQPIVLAKRIKRKPYKYLAQTKPTEQKVDAALPTKDFGFIMNPAFVEALIQMNIGEYQKALVILDSLKELPQISTTEKIRIMNKISECYKGVGNFQITLENLTNRYNKAKDKIEKSNLLWEIINVKSNCLQDYDGAEKDISTYIKLYPDGVWIESAYAKVGEIQYITGKYSKAIGTFRYHINLFKSSNLVENSIYTLANILRMDVKEYKMALKWYTKLLKEYTSSKYYGNALFERAECYEKLKLKIKARNDYKKYLELFPEGHLKTLCLARLSSHD